MIQVILTDIEGTTSSISFVHDVLFPYAEHLPGFIRANHHTLPAVAERLARVAEISGTDQKDIDGLINVLQGWIAEDRKEALKALQGMVWEQGYHSSGRKAISIRMPRIISSAGRSGPETVRIFFRVRQGPEADLRS